MRHKASHFSLEEKVFLGPKVSGTNNELVVVVR